MRVWWKGRGWQEEGRTWAGEGGQVGEGAWKDERVRGETVLISKGKCRRDKRGEVADACSKGKHSRLCL